MRLAYKLAVMSGRTDVRKMLKGMTAKQFIGWENYSIIDPFDEQRADYRAAQIVAMLAEVNRNHKKRKNPYTIDEFLLQFKELKAPTREQSLAERKNIYKMLAQAFSK